MPRQVADGESVKQATVAVGSACLVSSLFLGGLYVLWALFVVSGVAQWLMNVVSKLHFIPPVYVIEDVHPLRAIALVLLSAAAGYAIGGAVALLWNHGCRSRE